MQKKRLLSFLILGLLVSVIAVQFGELVSADKVTDWIKDNVINPLGTGKGLGDGFSRFLFGAVIALLVYAVTDKLPGMNKSELTWARWVIAGIVAYFGSVFLAEGELFALITSYSALGFALGVILPFLILIFFSYDIVLSENIHNAWVKRLLLRVVWGIFLAFILYRLLLEPTEESAPAVVSSLLWVIAAITVAVIILSKGIIIKLSEGETLNTIQSLHNQAMIVKANREAHELEAGARS